MRNYVAVAIVSAVSAGAFGSWLGFNAGATGTDVPEERMMYALESIFYQEKRELADARASTQEHLDALALRLGQLQAHIIRLDALGERLTSIGKLDAGEFDFAEDPAVGGPDSSEGEGEPIRVSELVAELDALSLKIADREGKLRVLETLIMNREMERQMRPTGRPIKNGWVSSYFGKRQDPFNGRKTWHKGVDFAGKKGSEVIAVASGIVTEVSERNGYGELVEIQHANGYSTRYAHNAEVLVDEGDRISQGQVIALMGSTGRSTGPHVHFEVLKNGTQVDPIKYVKNAR